MKSRYATVVWLVLALGAVIAGGWQFSLTSLQARRAAAPPEPFAGAPEAVAVEATPPCQFSASARLAIPGDTSTVNAVLSQAGKVFISVEGDGAGLFRLSLPEGKQLWSAHLGKYWNCKIVFNESGQPAGGHEALASDLALSLDGQRLYAVVPNTGTLIALDTTTGRQLEEAPLASISRLLSAEIDGRAVLLVIGEREAYAVDQAGLNHQLWRREFPAELAEEGMFYGKVGLGQCAWDEAADTLYACLPARRQVVRMRLSRWGSKLRDQARSLTLTSAPDGLLPLPGHDLVAVALGGEHKLLLLDARSLAVRRVVAWLPGPPELCCWDGVLIGTGEPEPGPVDAEAESNPYVRVTQFATLALPDGAPRLHRWPGQWRMFPDYLFNHDVYLDEVYYYAPHLALPRPAGWPPVFLNDTAEQSQKLWLYDPRSGSASLLHQFDSYIVSAAFCEEPQEFLTQEFRSKTSRSEPLGHDGQLYVFKLAQR